ncbi:MAG: hypothetical protein NT023_21315, partial [Armatimonadetes bacterium]|nr:hypothetical protein [Armatimonadota bacterium]
MRRPVICLCAFMMTWTFASRTPSFGMIMSTLTTEETPPKKLIDNLQAYIKKHPKDAATHYELGRVYSVLYASNKKSLQAAFRSIDGKSLKRGVMQMGYEDFGNPLYPDKGAAVSLPKQEQEKFLRLSLECYMKSLNFGTPHPKQERFFEAKYSYSLLGYGWMLEQGMKFAKTLPAIFKDPPAIATEEEWRNEALKALRRVYKEYAPSRKRPLHILGGFQIPAREAAASIVRLQEKRTDTQSKQETAALKTWLREAEGVSRSISPIIFPMNGCHTLSQLVAPHRAVRFDLMGDRMGTRWSWVNARAGILVWDPLHNGLVRSGYQLFGNVTWCMIWKYGYAPLARLDANGDGWLTGKELEGIAVWQDKNGNGVSDRGEVMPLSRLGVAR